MRKDKKKVYPAVQFGSSFMLVIFIVLCLTAFACLSLSGALRDYRYSVRSAEKTTDYYEADKKAEQKLSEIAGVLKSVPADPADHYLEQAVEALRTIDGLAIDLKDAGAPRISYEIPVNDKQVLQAALALYDRNQRQDGYFKILSWKEAASSDWENTSSLPVIGSEEP